MRCFIMEDDSAYMELIEHALAAEGHRVVLSAHSRRGVRMAVKYFGFNMVDVAIVKPTLRRRRSGSTEPGDDGQIASFWIDVECRRLGRCVEIVTFGGPRYAWSSHYVSGTRFSDRLNFDELSSRARHRLHSNMHAAALRLSAYISSLQLARAA